MFRLLGLLAGVAGVTDLGVGAAPDESLHRAALAARLARAAGCDDAGVRDALVVALLEHVGCTAYSHEISEVWGDDIAVLRAVQRADPGSTADLVRTFVPSLAEASGRSWPAVALTMARTMPRMARQAPPATCEVAQHAARRLGLGTVVEQSLGHLTAMWDGKGVPRARGEAIPLPTRVMRVAAAAVIRWETDGIEAAVAQVRHRTGGELDPALAGLFADRAHELLDGLDGPDPLALVLDAEPDPVERVDAARRLDVARTCGDLVDLKSPWLHGHSSAVGDLAGAAAEALGLPEADDVRVAGHLHDVGRVAIPARVWTVARPWTAAEQDHARLHPYHTERALARTPELAFVAELAAAHHERCDGSGYHRGVRADRLSIGARVLAAADQWCSLVEDRPHRPALDPADVRRRLERDVRDGRLDVDAVKAVLAATGARPSRPAGTSGLTPRQLEVLRLVTRGLSNREIAARLVLSPRTVERHVADAYGRIGVTTRAGAALYAIEHGLLAPDI